MSSPCTERKTLGMVFKLMQLCETVGAGLWFGQMEGMDGVPGKFRAVFHEDGCFEDGHNFHRHNNPARWGVSARDGLVVDHAGASKAARCVTRVSNKKKINNACTYYSSTRTKKKAKR